MALFDKEQMLSMKPKDFRSLVKKGEWTDITLEVCQGYAQANLVVIPKEFAFDFQLFVTVILNHAQFSMLQNQESIIQCF